MERHDCSRTGIRQIDVRLHKDRRQVDRCQTVQRQASGRWRGVRLYRQADGEMSDCADRHQVDGDVRLCKDRCQVDRDVRLCKDRHQVDGEMSDCAKTGVRQMERCQTVKDKRQVDGRDFFWVVVEVVGSSLSLGGAVLGCAPCDMCSPMACCSSLFSQLHNPVVFLFFLEYGQFCLRIQRLNSL